MGKCDAMRVTEWLIEWAASQERRSVACHTSEFPNWEPEITRIVGSLPIISGRDMIARHGIGSQAWISRAPNRSVHDGGRQTEFVNH